MKKKAIKTEDIPRGTPQYIQGRESYENGSDDCPYPKGNHCRVGWWCGYLDARTVDRLGPHYENWSKMKNAA